jgi:hypothetical protein
MYKYILLSNFFHNYFMIPLFFLKKNCFYNKNSLLLLIINIYLLP